jgi:hypothetical protein
VEVDARAEQIPGTACTRRHCRRVSTCSWTCRRAS